MSSIKHYASLVKISHTIFAMPFAVAGYFLALRQHGAMVGEWRILLLMVACMVFARNAAMSFNRYADRRYDALNVRTNMREIPRGVIAARHALRFCVVNAMLFVVAAFFINKLCLWLAPVALLVVLGYSYTKRFTAMSHFVLGFALAIAPVGAYIAVSGVWAWDVVVLSGVVLLWVAGFDIVYSLADEDFDRGHRLFSVPAVLGARRALWLSLVVHVVCGVGSVFFGMIIDASALYYVGAGLFVVCLMYQHFVAIPAQRYGVAFTLFNGVASVVYSIFIVLECVLM